MSFLLSIIIPFYNVEERSNSSRLLDYLKKLDATDYSDVELIFVDDGSIDDTFNLLANTSGQIGLSVDLIRQENRGPGGARNSGLSKAKGEYIWFVDSDDSIDLSVINELRSLKLNEFDFIDFDYDVHGEKLNSMKQIPYGDNHDNLEMKSSLVKEFGRLWTKIFNKEFLTRNNLFYPENCFYEDNYLSILMPFYVKRFYKSKQFAYYYMEDFSSISRSPVNERYFDRVLTAYFALKRLHEEKFEGVESLLGDRFFDLIINLSTRRIIKSKQFNYFPEISKLLSFYDDSIKELGFKKVNINSSAVRMKTSTRFMLLIFKPFSYVEKGTRDYFLLKNKRAWNGHQILFKV